MKKMLSLLAAVSLGITGVFADTPTERQPEMLDYIAKLKAQEYVHLLASLKAQLMLYPPGSKDAQMETIRGQMDVVNRELLALVVVPLQIKKKELEKTYEEQKKITSEQNPRMLNLKDEIAQIDLQIARAKAELVGSTEK